VTTGQVLSGTLGVYLLKHTVIRNGVIALLLLAVLAGCNSDSGPPSAAFLPGGVDAFQKKLDNERGKPVVVNKWASWCGPCRLEFPLFRKQAEKRRGKVVFIGVDSNDNRGDAEDFLKEEPVPFKHFEDPKLEIAATFNAVQAFPSTAFYDSKGKLAFVHQGPFTTEQQLSEAIDRYAR
jgi:cytochrome c biogenesis protein CcmG, thiol:disulfide interchange protein DsbE